MPEPNGEWCQVAPDPKTPAQRKADQRARNKEAGLSEVRGIHAPPYDHPTCLLYTSDAADDCSIV